jgi:excisionase family DNA binding protein
MATRQLQNQSPLLTIGRASRMLGVSETTLRQWTDEGKIKAFITPGGHRRYIEAEIISFMGTQHRVQGIRDLVAKIEMTPPIEMELAQTHFANMPWYGRLDSDSKARLGSLGRKLYGMVIMSITKQNKQEQAMQLAREVGHEFGTYLAEIGLSLSDSLEAFMLHRSPLINATTDLIRRRGALNERAAEAMPLVSRTTDEALLSLVNAHQEYNKNSATADEGCNK